MSAIIRDRENQKAAIRGRTFQQQRRFAALTQVSELSGALQ
jgi:hypothetical protein